MGFLLLGIVVPKMIDGLPDLVSYGSAAVGVLLIIGAYVAHLVGSSRGGDVGGTQASHGSHSPNLSGSFHAPITFNQGPVAERGTQKPAPAEARKSPLPDMPLEEVLGRLFERFGAVSDEDEGALELIERRILEAIVDAAYHQRLDVWGRLAPGKPAKIVWRDAWERGQLLIHDNRVEYRPPDNPSSMIRWSGLMFNRMQVDRLWPRDLGPNGWMAR